MTAFKRAEKSRADATFHDHLKELRTRAFVVVLVFLTAASLAYTYKDPILSVLMKPLAGEKLIYLTPAGGFSFIFQVTLYVGIVAVIPLVMFSVFRFLAPVLARKTQVMSAVVMISSLLLLVSGASFGYFFAIPAAMDFLIHFADGFANASLTAQSYLGFVMAYTAGLGALFQLPLILLFIHWVRPLRPRKLLAFERYVLLFSFVIAAIISPTPDAVNQAIIAMPIIVMYQVGVIAVWVSVVRAKRREGAGERKQLRRAKKAVLAVSSAPAAAIAPAVRQIVPSVVGVAPATAARSAKAVAASPAKTPQQVQPAVRAVAPAPGRGRSLDGVRSQRTTRIEGALTAHIPSRNSVAAPSSLNRAVSQSGPRRSLDGVSVILKELDDAAI